MSTNYRDLYHEQRIQFLLAQQQADSANARVKELEDQLKTLQAGLEKLAGVFELLKLLETHLNYRCCCQSK